jgi:hypothetical protein
MMVLLLFVFCVLWVILLPVARRRALGWAAITLTVAALGGCASKTSSTTVLAPTEWQVRVESPVQKSSGLANAKPTEGTGLTRVARLSVAAILAAPGVSGAATAPRVIVDPAGIVLNGPMDPQTLADRLRCELNEAANGRLLFLDRTTAAMPGQKSRPAAEFRLEAVAAPAPASAPAAKPGATSWAITLRLMGARTTTPIWSESYVWEERP